ncbi:MAG: flagellar basal body P-ring protein FlgI [Myxococcota bacterium]
MFRILMLAMFFISPSADAARVKDIAGIFGVRDNSVFGYGLVTGLNRTGDSRRNEATIRTLANRLQGLGVTLSTDDIISRNVAVVMVTSRIPSTARPGHQIDVEVSSTGDAKSLEGGILQLTALYASDGRAYASSQGAIVIGGFSAEAGGESTRKNHPNTGRIPRGATVELDNPNRMDITNAPHIDWLINDPDFTTAKRMADAINTALGTDAAKAHDDGMVRMVIEKTGDASAIDILAQIEMVEIEVDSPARVVVNERTGTVVMGANVQVSAVAVAHGGLSIEVQRDTEVSQPGALSSGDTVVTRDSRIVAEEESGRLTMLEGVTIGQLVGALNSMGVKPRDLIQIMLTIKAAGALHAEIASL